MGNLIFNGISTVDMGVQIQTPPVYEFPDKLYDVIHIEGRNGDLVIDKKSYQNVKRTYFLALGFRKNTTFVTNARMLVEWLLTAEGYARLEDSYEPDYYRMAMFEDPGEMTNYYGDATALEVSFNCKPQRFLKTGDAPIIFPPSSKDSYIQIINPTMYISLPEITTDGDNLKIEVYSGLDYNNPKNYSSVSSSYNNEFVVDSDIQDCYSNEQYINNSITLQNEFPKLYPGKNWIRITGTNLRKFEIKPRWWTL